VIFIEINFDKIINTFTKNFLVNVVNVYHIYELQCETDMAKAQSRKFEFP